MKTVSIFEKRWIELVFEGKNKAYGAYQLRQENSKTSVMAFLFGLLFIGSISGLGMLLSSFGDVPVVVIPPSTIDTVVVVNIEREHPKVETKPAPKVTPPAENPNPKLAPVISKEPTPEPKNPSTTPPTNGTPSTGEPSPLPPTTGIPTGGSEPKTPFVGIATKGMLDKEPEFPEGMDKFYAFVAKNFDKPEDVDNAGNIRVIVSFVIERDGSMSNIKVAKDPGYGLAEEAIRVLKSLKTKWIAGIMDSEKVRTAYSLPIVIELK
jgi:periplasmic protein TonB